MIESALLPLFKWQRFKKIWFVFFICLATLNITACDYINDKLYPDFKANDVKTAVEKPPFARQNTAPNISIEKVRDIAASSTEDDSNFTVNPVALKNEIADPKGLKTAQLFSTPTKTDEERFTRLEERVQKISDTLNKMSPSITKLIAIESELDSLTFQLEELISQGKFDRLVDEKREIKQAIKTSVAQPTTPKKPTAPPPSTSPSPKEQPKKSNTTKPQAGNLIYKIRLGDHPDKTRIVFETTEKLSYTISLDNDEKIMAVIFPKGSFGSNLSKISRQSNMIKSITQNKDGDGNLIAFELTQTAQKPKDFRISPDAEISRHRIVIDLKR